MTKEHMLALFLLAGIKIEGYWQIKNEYDSSDPESPWWLVKTKRGLIKIGWRKRVINIDWKDTDIRFPQDAVVNTVITLDDVTKDETSVHAWGYAKAVEYLTALAYKIKYNN